MAALLKPVHIVSKSPYWPKIAKRSDSERDLQNCLLTAEEFLNFKQTTSLRQIEIICSVFRERSISKTARILGMSSANVSLTCDRFESHFSFAIFEKRRNGVVFTEDAHALIVELQKLEECVLAVSEAVVDKSQSATVILESPQSDK